MMNVPWRYDAKRTESFLVKYGNMMGFLKLFTTGMFDLTYGLNIVVVYGCSICIMGICCVASSTTKFWGLLPWGWVHGGIHLEFKIE